jgi:hypothetical protein
MFSFIKAIIAGTVLELGQFISSYVENRLRIVVPPPIRPLDNEMQMIREDVPEDTLRTFKLVCNEYQEAKLDLNDYLRDAVLVVGMSSGSKFTFEDFKFEKCEYVSDSDGESLAFEIMAISFKYGPPMMIIDKDNRLDHALLSYLNIHVVVKNELKMTKMFPFRDSNFMRALLTRNHDYFTQRTVRLVELEILRVISHLLLSDVYGGGLIELNDWREGDRVGFEIKKK